MGDSFSGYVISQFQPSLVMTSASGTLGNPRSFSNIVLLAIIRANSCPQQDMFFCALFDHHFYFRELNNVRQFEWADHFITLFPEVLPLEECRFGIQLFQLTFIGLASSTFVTAWFSSQNNAMILGDV